jgi:hypothetical protein
MTEIKITKERKNIGSPHIPPHIRALVRAASELLVAYHEIKQPPNRYIAISVQISAPLDICTTDIQICSDN